MELSSPHEDSSPEEAPSHSSMVVKSPGRMTPALSPISELVEPLDPPRLIASPDCHMVRLYSVLGNGGIRLGGDVVS